MDNDKNVTEQNLSGLQWTPVSFMAPIVFQLNLDSNLSVYKPQESFHALALLKLTEGAEEHHTFNDIQTLPPNEATTVPFLTSEMLLKELTQLYF